MANGDRIADSSRILFPNFGEKMADAIDSTRFGDAAVGISALSWRGLATWRYTIPATASSTMFPPGGGCGCWFRLD